MRALKRLIEGVRAILEVFDKKTASDADQIPSDAEIRDSLQKTLLDSYGQEYESLVKISAGIETKSQGNVAIAGIFVAGMFVFVKDLKPKMTCYETAFLTAAICLLLGSIVLSMLSLRVRKNPAPPSGDAMDTLVSPLLQLTSGAELKERFPFLIKDQVRLWQNVVTRAVANIRTKARFLLSAQICLGLAIAIMAALTVTQVLR